MTDIEQCEIHERAKCAGLKGWLYRELEPDIGRPLSWSNRFLVVLVLSSFLALALETEPTISGVALRALHLFNWVVVIIFLIEYSLRFWVAGLDPRYAGFRGRIRYATTIFALADLAAFLPELLLLIFAGQTANGQSVAILKALRLFRLLKLARYIPAFGLLARALEKARGQLLTTFFVAFALVYISAIALFYIEGPGSPKPSARSRAPSGGPSQR